MTQTDIERIAYYTSKHVFLRNELTLGESEVHQKGGETIINRKALELALNNMIIFVKRIKIQDIYTYI